MKTRLRRVASLSVRKGVSGERPVLSLEHVATERGAYSEVPRPVGPAPSDCLAFEPGEVLFSKLRPYLSKSLLVSEPLFGSSEFLAMRPNEQVDPQYLFFVTLPQPWLDWSMASSYGTKMPRTSWEEMGDFALNLPPLDEQRRISAFLTEQVAVLDGLAQSLGRQVEMLTDRKWAAIRRTLTHGLNGATTSASNVPWLESQPVNWTTAPLKYIARIQRGASPRPIDDPIYFDDAGSHAWVRISDVSASGKYLLTSEQTLSDLGRSLSVALKPGELFVSIAGSVGKPVITKIPCCIHDGFVAIRFPEVRAELIYYCLLLGDCFAGLGKLGTQLNLNSETVGNIRVPIPPSTEQDLMVLHLDQIVETHDLALTAAKAQSTLLKERRRALITHAVGGSVDPATLREVHPRDY